MNEKNLERVELQHLEVIERRVAELAATVPQPGDGCLECETCGDEVAPARAALGYRTCILCAEAQDRLAKVYAAGGIERGAPTGRPALPMEAEPPE